MPPTDEQMGILAAELAGIQRELGRLCGRVDIAIDLASKAYDAAMHCNQTLRDSGIGRESGTFGGADEPPTHPGTPTSIAPRSRQEIDDAHDPGRPSALTQVASVRVMGATLRGPAVIVGGVTLCLAVIAAFLAARGVHLPL